MMSSILATLGLDVSPFRLSLMRAQSDARMVGREISSALTEKLGEFGSIAGIEETIRRSIELGEKIYDLSRRLGISTDSVQLWDSVLRKNGSSIDSAVGAFEKLAVARQKIMSGAQGSDSLTDAFRKLGVSIDDVNNKGLRNEDIMLRIAEAFEKGDPQRLIGAFRQIGGRGAGELVAAFRAGLGPLMDEEKTKITIITPDQVALLKEAADDARTLWTNIKGISAAFTAGAIEWKDTVVESVEQAGAAINAFGSSISKQIGSPSGILKALGPITGVFDIFHKARLEAVGAMKKVEDLNDLDRMKRQEERANSRRLGPTNTEDEGVETVKQANAAKKIADEILAIKNETARVERAAAMDALTTAQKIVELQNRIARTKSEIEEAYDDKDEAQSRLTLAKQEAELAKLERDKSKEDEQEQRKLLPKTPHVSDREKIGAYTSTNNEHSLLRTGEKSLAQLEAIRKHLEGIDRGQDHVRY